MVAEFIPTLKVALKSLIYRHTRGPVHGNCGDDRGWCGRGHAGKRPDIIGCEWIGWTCLVRSCGVDGSCIYGAIGKTGSRSKGCHRPGCGISNRPC